MKSSDFVFGAAIAAAAVLYCAASAHAAVDPDAARIIEQSRAAMHAPALQRIHALKIDSTLHAAGLSGTQTQWIDLTTSRLAEFANLPPLQQDDGYNGSVAWNRDQTGLVWNDGGDAGRSTAITNAYVSSFGLWKPNAGGASVSYDGLKTDAGHQYDVLRVVAPGSKVPAQLWFDHTTHLLTRDVQAIGPVVNAATFSHYKMQGGLMLPWTIHVDNSNGNNADVLVTSVTINPPGVANRVLRPKSTVHDFSMQNGQPSTTVPIDLVDNHVYIDVMLNGKGPYHMIFDTGGANIIDPAVAQEVGALGKGSVQGSGVGAQTESISFANVKSLQVGDAALRDQLFAVAPVRAGFGVSGGRPADGLIGWEVLARYDTTFDYAGKHVTLTLPSAAREPAGAHVVPFVFNSTQPQIACRIDNVPSECTIDTGARDTMTFYSPFLAEHPEVKPPTLTALGVNGFGVGGASMSQLGRLASITIDDLTLHDLIAGYSDATKGAFANPFTAANLGGNLLRRFNVTFDYGRETMALVPNDAFAERDTYERSGLFLVNLGGKFTVVDARPGTPAAEAGVAKGDVITAVNGTPASSMTLAALRDVLRQPAGTPVKIDVSEKSGQTKTVSFTLRDYI